MVSRLKAPDLDSHKRTIDVSSFNTHTSWCCELSTFSLPIRTILFKYC